MTSLLNCNFFNCGSELVLKSRCICPRVSFVSALLKTFSFSLILQMLKAFFFCCSCNDIENLPADRFSYSLCYFTHENTPKYSEVPVLELVPSCGAYNKAAFST